jgi:hypothetical protein
MLYFGGWLNGVNYSQSLDKSPGTWHDSVRLESEGFSLWRTESWGFRGSILTREMMSQSHILTKRRREIDEAPVVAFDVVGFRQYRTGSV